MIFDPEGEYFWPDDKGRPGLCDVPYLEDKLVVFTGRRNPSLFYQSFVAGGIKLDIRRLRPADVIAIALSPERQDQQNVRKLRALSQDRWESLVNLIDEGGNATDVSEISRILDLETIQAAEALAARANMTAIVRMLHDKSSQLMDMLMKALAEGKLCIIDVSQMRGGQSLILSGLILRRIFDRNQQEFTSAEPKTIPTIAVVEEAQAVLTDKASASEPYITWVKEGRKYNLGALLITQQPGSIPTEILSQGDNWFIFHMLSAADLGLLKKANAHFSDDLLSSLLNEPIPGQGVYWSSVSGKPYPVSLLVLSFEHMFKTRDPEYKESAIDSYAQKLRSSIMGAVPTVPDVASTYAPGETHDASPEEKDHPQIDRMEVIESKAIAALHADRPLMTKVESPDGIAWGSLKAFFLNTIPADLDNRADIAYRLVPKAMSRFFGDQGKAWEAYRNQERNATYVRKV